MFGELSKFPEHNHILNFKKNNENNLNPYVSLILKLEKNI
jgi:hypothetical protein